MLNYDILDGPRRAARRARAARADPRRVALREEPARARAPRRRSSWPSRLPDDALRLALTGTPILNRPEELVAQLRVLGRLRDFGSGARLVAPLPRRRQRRPPALEPARPLLRPPHQEAGAAAAARPSARTPCPVLLSNEHEYRLAEQDVIAWLQTLPLDLRTIDAKVAAALRAEQLVRLNNLRQLAARGKLPDRARLDRGLPRVGRAAGGVRRAHRDPAGRARALPRRARTSSAPTPPRTASARSTPSSARTARS